MGNQHDLKSKSLEQLLNQLDKLVESTVTSTIEKNSPKKTITYAIGDPQGCYDELRRLLDKIKFNPEKHRLWFTGDLVNRGPNSLNVLRFVRDLGKSAITVLGNHDLQLLASAAGIMPVKKKDTIAGILEAPDISELLHWLRFQPVMHYDNCMGFAMVHAGLHPKWDLYTALSCASELEKVLQGDQYVSFLQNINCDNLLTWSPELKGEDRLSFICNCFTQLRYCDKKGRLILNINYKDAQKKGYYRWFEAPKRVNRKLPIVFGHWAALSSKKVTSKNIYPLDSACVQGGSLTALHLEKNRYFKVRCREALAYS